MSVPAGRRAGEVGDAASPGSPLLPHWVPDGGLLPLAGHSEVLASGSVYPAGAGRGPGCLGHGTPPRAILCVSNAASLPADSPAQPSSRPTGARETDVPLVLGAVRILPQGSFGTGRLRPPKAPEDQGRLPPGGRLCLSAPAFASARVGVLPAAGQGPGGQDLAGWCRP